MRRGTLMIAVLSMLVIVFAAGSAAGASGTACQPTISLVNQEPYPVTPGDYVKLVFQISGVEDPNCNYLSFELVPKYPISFDPGTDSTILLRGGTFSGSDYGSYIMVPFKVRVDPNALEGDNPIEVEYSTSGPTGSSISSQFNLQVNNTLADFNVFVKDFNFATNQITLEILNVGKNDVKSLSVELPQQQEFKIKGPNVYVVGSLDSNDYTTASFEVSPNAGNLNMTISYNDIIGVRRNIDKQVYFDPSAFQNRKTAPSGSATGYIILIVLVGGIAAYIFYRRYKKKRKKRLLQRG
jgi:hypothetical protein